MTPSVALPTLSLHRLCWAVIFFEKEMIKLYIAKVKYYSLSHLADSCCNVTF